MENKKDCNELFCIFGETLFFIKTLLSEFESVFNNKRIINEISTVRLVYMEVIIINLAKLFGNAKNDKFRICHFKDISPQIEKEVEKIEKSHEDIIGKVISNRNKIIAHSDKNFHELCFSNNHRVGIEKVFRCDLSKMNRAISRDKEHYDIGDLKNDLPEIRKLIEKAEKILDEALNFNYLEGFPKEFIEQDEIDMSKFLANYEIMKNGTKEMYQATIKSHNQNNLSDNATETICWMAKAYNHPKWFMTAYPDVVKWFSNLEDEKIISITGNPTPDFADDANYFKLPILRKIVDEYKTIYNLECRIPKSN